MSESPPNRRKLLLLAASAVLAGVVFAGCGGGGTTTTTTSAAPPFKAAAALITVADLPSGWVAKETAADDEDPGFCGTTAILGGKALDEAEAEFGQGGSSDEVPGLSDSVIVYSPGEASAVFAAYRRAMASCTSFTADGVTFDAAPVSFPRLGDGTVAMLFTTDDFGVPYGIYLVAVRVKDGIALVAYGWISPSVTEAESFARLATDKLRQAQAGGAASGSGAPSDTSSTGQKTYANGSSIVAALQAAGISCDNYVRLEDPIHSGPLLGDRQNRTVDGAAPVEHGSCQLGGDKLLEILVFQNRSDTNAYKRDSVNNGGCRFAKSNGLPSISYVDGGAWIIEVDPETDTKPIANALHAKSVTADCRGFTE